MKKIVIASQNQGKIQEFQAMLSPLGYVVLSPKDLDIQEDIEETGTSFLENAILKAQALRKSTDLDIIADDSGLEVMALHGNPGVHSKRYSKESTAEANNQLLLKELEGISDRRARFVATIVYLDRMNHIHHFEGVVDGTILCEPKGCQGFGYDPIFEVEEFGKSMAELSMDVKNQVSHRARALHKLIHFLEESNENPHL